MERLFDCDPAKRERLIADRGIDLLSLIPIFADRSRLDFEDRRRDYGEMRYVTIGQVGGRVFTLVYTIEAR
ncbi:BrnT family toxin [Enterovirga aerilata]|uniref:BrnT family toxin n=1 Tax=Enterovirga aerilata TaxID=2730920 RepID=A0A849HZC2_9HYPH|nr:BrnT family toxin [Enterovirga sp. DB1703]NNM72886.1 BrnT family toxin [Enterovirga sp. DB1703]